MLREKRFMYRKLSALCVTVILLITLFSPAASADYATLRQGSSGSDVLSMQYALKTLGYTITVDGKYGSATTAVVRQFQKNQGLTADGIAGSKTLTRLYSLTSGISQTPVQATPTPSGSGTAWKVKTTGGSLNLRSAPQTNAAILKTMPNNSAVTVYYTSGSWSYISYNGILGYAMTSYLTPVSTPVSTSVPTATPTAVPTQTPAPVPQSTSSSTGYATVHTTGGTLNMRSEGTTAARVITTIKNKTRITVLSRGSAWSLVTYNGYTGYVMNTYLIFETAAVTNTPTCAPSPTPTASLPVSANTVIGTATVKTTGATLNLRSAPSLSAKVISEIPNKTMMYVFSYDTEWSYVTVNGMTGYVSNAYISYTPYTYTTAQPTVTPQGGYDTSLFTRTLRSGYTGQDVAALQERLVDLNYLTDSNITGKYDTATMNAVKLFQTLHGLSADGLAGQYTFAQLFSEKALPYSISETAALTTLHIYYRNQDSQNTSAIARMQNALSQLGYDTPINGSFDEKTYQAVLDFELRNNISVTGAATVQMQSLLYSGNAKPYSAAPSVQIADAEARISGPDTGSVQLLHWFNTVKPTLKSGDKLTVFDPLTHYSWTLLVYSCGNHCDSQPATLRDTLIMNKAFGTPSWTVHPVYICLPSGTWTLATMHNRPHLTASVTDNGFDGHLCVHFLRDLDEVKKNDSDYGLTNQTTLRSAWKNLTGITVN